MEKIEATSLNIVILPSSGVTDLAINLSQRIGRNFPTEFTLDRERFVPHITVYQASFPQYSVPRIEDELRSIASTTSPFRINMEGFIIRHETILFWLCVKSPALQSLHDETARRVNPLREGLVLPHLAHVTGLSAEDKEDIKNFGMMGIGPRFIPHLTISRLSNLNDSNAAVNSLRRVNNKAMFEVKELVLGHLGPHGTFNGVIARFKLGD